MCVHCFNYMPRAKLSTINVVCVLKNVHVSALDVHVQLKHIMQALLLFVR